jgi:hypothetical protein
VPTLHFVLIRTGCRLGLSSSAVAQQLQFLLSGVPITSVREDIRTVQVGALGRRHAARSGQIGDFTLVGATASAFRCRSGKVEVRMEEPICAAATARRPSPCAATSPRLAAAGRLDRHHGSCSPSSPSCRPATASSRPAPSRNRARPPSAMLPLFPIMLAITLLIIILQVRSISAMVMVFLTSPLGLIGVVPTLILFSSPSASMRWSA